MKKTLSPILLSLTIVNFLIFTYILRSVKQEERSSVRDTQGMVDEYSRSELNDKWHRHEKRDDDPRDDQHEGGDNSDTQPAQPREAEKNKDIIVERLPAKAPKVFQYTTGPTPIILHTYMRSGSSFVGDLLKAGTETYYTFEPVHALQFTIRRNEPIRYLDRTSKTFNSFLDVAVPTVRDMVTCQFAKLPVPYFEDGFFGYSTRASVFTQCNNGQRMITDTAKAYKCAGELSKECSKSSFFVAKIIRMPLYSIEELMEQIPNLKIVHLLRDPRPTALSQLKAGGNIRKLHLKANVTSYCNRVYDDVVKADDFNRKFPGRLLRVHYEDIVQQPFEFTRKMYNFAEMPFTAQVSATIAKLTGHTENHKSSNDKASAWRSSVDMQFIRAVDSSCAQLYKRVGYQTMATEADIRDTSRSLRGPPPPFDDFRLA